MRRLLLVFALLFAFPAWAQPHPFGGEVLDLLGEVEGIRSGATPEARRAAADALLETLYRDPYLKELGPRLNLKQWLRGVADGRAFDATAFRSAAEAAARASTSTTADVGVNELLQKLEVLEMALSGRRPARTGGRLTGGDAVANNGLSDVLGRRNTRVMAMESVPGARVLRVSETVSLPAGPRDAVALDLYGRVLVPEGRGAGSGEGVLRAGLAHREVGRAVLGPTVRHPMGGETADVLKGVGPTPWANNKNRFNSKATGTFPLPEAVRDWEKTEVLRRAGVAVAEPVAIVALPYAEWSKSEGWRPVAVYVRRPRENLRVSDLDHMSRRQKRALMARLKANLEAELRSVGRAESLSNADVIRAFVERLGRTAGLFQGGMGGGRYYFHGMLHDQNVSLLGEIVDVGNGEGVRRTRAEMRADWANSNYAWWPERLREYRGMRGDVETLLFDRMARAYNERLASVAGGGISEAELKEIFTKAYRDGRRGGSASDPRRTLTIRAEARTARSAESDALARFRRADGTLDWKRMARERAPAEAAGLAHFALALFLKEVAVVAATGDRARIEEFFEGLLTTDFYQHYGLFVAGARLGEIGYTRYLQRYVKPQFVNGLLKTNLVLAAGMALPLIVEGNFEGRAFAISVASLGLSSAAVKAGVRGISWVTSLKKAKDSGRLARLGASAGRLAKLGGWFYTAVELAVILYVAEEVDGYVNERLDLAAARDALADAGAAFVAAANEATTEGELERAADAYHGAWNDYRNVLYRPLHMDEAALAARMEKVARRAKLAADEREAVLERVRGRPALLESVTARYGSLEAYADALVKKDEAALQEDVDTYLASYDMNREKHLREVYEANRRADGLLSDVDDLDWHLAGGEDGGASDPYGNRGDVLARLGRSRSRSGFEDALGGASRNRMQAYDDEVAVLNAVAESLRARGEAELAGLLAEDAVARVGRLRDADRRLVDEGPAPVAAAEVAAGVEPQPERANLTERVNGIGQ